MEHVESALPKLLWLHVHTYKRSWLKGLHQAIVLNAAAEKLIRLPTDKSHADNENDETFYDVTDNSSGNC